jgi:putative ABC transport system permease protein
MTAVGTGNRAMYWRIVRRLLGANRGRLVVILLALGAGAAVTAALLNLQIDAKRRITTEFRAFGANVIVASRAASDASPVSATLDSAVLERIPSTNGADPVGKLGLFYLLATAQADDDNFRPRLPLRSIPVLVAGYGSQRIFDSRDVFDTMIPNRKLQESKTVFLDIPECELGEKVAEALHASPTDLLELKIDGGSIPCSVFGIRTFGGPEDNQIFVPLSDLAYRSGRTGQLSIVLLSVPGTSAQIDSYVSQLRSQLPAAEVRPLRQFSDTQTKIYGRISGLLTATVVVVLVLTGLCVMAAMTNVAMERKNDVGLMKAIGGATRRVLRLFMMEAALLGLAGGVIGAAAGIFLSIWLGKQVFGVAAQPRLIVYPVAVALTTIVAILSAYPLRRLASVRPASVFRGEA